MEVALIYDDDKVPTGIHDFDLALLGGYKKSSTIAIVGGVEKEKYVFGYYFASIPPSLIVAVDFSPTEIINKAKDYDLDLSSEKVKFIDAYSKNAGISPREDDIIVNSPSSLTDISIAISNYIKDVDNPRVLFLTYSTIHNSSPKSALQFLKVIDGKVKSKNGNIMLIIDKFSHEEEELKKILAICDEVYHLEVEDDVITFKGKNLKIPLKMIVSNLGIGVV